jgi:hypothetical protein
MFGSRSTGDLKDNPRNNMNIGSDDNQIKLKSNKLLNNYKVKIDGIVDDRHKQRELFETIKNIRAKRISQTRTKQSCKGNLILII